MPRAYGPGQAEADSERLENITQPFVGYISFIYSGSDKCTNKFNWMMMGSQEIFNFLPMVVDTHTSTYIVSHPHTSIFTNSFMSVSISIYWQL